MAVVKGQNKAHKIVIPEDMVARYDQPDGAERFDAATRMVFSLSPERAEKIRKEADSIRNPKGRPPKAEPSASRVPVAPLQA
jgi:hypothetical protein